MTGDGRALGYWPLLFRQRNFALLLLSQLLAYFAIWTSNIALLHVAYTAMNSSMGPRILLTAQFLPAFLLMPVASRVIDRYGRRRTVLASTIGNGLLALVLPLGASILPIAWFFAVYVVYSASIAMFIIAGLTLLPMVVARADLARANCLLLATPSMMMVLSGASFMLQSAPGPGMHAEFLIVATLFFVSAAVFSRIRGLSADGDAADTRPGNNMLRTFIVGLRYLFRHRELAHVFAVRLSLYIGVGGQVLLALYSEELFGFGDSGTGLLYLARGLAILLGAFGLTQLVLRRVLNSTHAIAFGLAMFGLGYLLASVVSGFGIGAVALLLGVGFLGEGLLKSTTMALIHLHTHPDYLARVMAAEQGLSAVIQSGAALAIAACVVTGRPGTVLLASASTGCVLITASLAWFIKSVGKQDRVAPRCADQELTRLAANSCR